MTYFVSYLSVGESLEYSRLCTKRMSALSFPARYAIPNWLYIKDVYPTVSDRAPKSCTDHRFMRSRSPTLTPAIANVFCRHFQLTKLVSPRRITESTDRTLRSCLRLQLSVFYLYAHRSTAMRYTISGGVSLSLSRVCNGYFYLLAI